MTKPTRRSAASRRIGAALLALFLTVLTLSCWDGSGGGSPAPGPARLVVSGGSEVNAPIRTGESFTFGGVQVENHGRRPVTLEAVKLVGRYGRFEVLGMRVRVRTTVSEPSGIPLGDFGWPATSLTAPTRTVRDTVLRPAHLLKGTTAWFPATHLVVGVRATTQGDVGFRGVEIRYRTAGGESGTIRAENALHLCVSDDATYKTQCGR